MEDLIKINYDDERVTLSARELHEGLEIRAHFKDWFPRMCEYGFEERRDFTPLKFEHPQNKQQTTDYQITLEMAKEIAMLQRSDKGKEIRQYFIQIEKQWNSPDFIIKRAMELQTKKIELLLNGKEENRPKVVFADTILGSKDLILVRDLAKLLQVKGIDMGERKLFKWLRDNHYLEQNRNLPTQKATDLKVLQLTEGMRFNGAEPKITHTTKVTLKGQQYFLNKLIECMV